jgi:hypothetical protein
MKTNIRDTKNAKIEGWLGFLWSHEVNTKALDMTEHGYYFRGLTPNGWQDYNSLWINM